MTKRAKTALAVLKEGGYFRCQLETQYRGNEKFVYRLRDAEGYVVPGVGFKTFCELESKLTKRAVPVSTVWPREWVLEGA